MVENEDMEARIHPQPESRLVRALIMAAEVVLILIIIGLLIAIWLPAWIGSHPGVTPH